MRKTFVIFLCAAALALAACGSRSAPNAETNSALAKNDSKTAATTPATAKTEDGFVASETGTEKAKPESGKANVQGKVLFNEKPVEGIEVKLCEKFNSFSGCTGEQLTTKTDAGGEYLIANVTPKIYEGLLVRVFQTKGYVFASNRFGITAAKYKIEPDQTFFAPATNLFKSDLKAQNPKPNAKVDAKDFEIKWDAYPEAAYYKFGMYAKDVKTTSPYVNEKTEGTSFKVEKPLTNGEYRLKIDAFNANDVKLAELAEDIKFTVTGGTESAEGNSNK